MSAAIESVKTSLNSIVGGLNQANLRIAVQQFSEAGHTYTKYGDTNTNLEWKRLNEALFPALFSVPGTNLKYNTLNNTSQGGTFYPMSPGFDWYTYQRHFDPSTEMNYIRTALNSISTTNHAQEENGLAYAQLGYQSILNPALSAINLRSVNPAFSNHGILPNQAFRGDAAAFVAIVVSDEDASQLSNMSGKIGQTRDAQSCSCFTPGSCSQYELRQYTTPCDNGGTCTYYSNVCVGIETPASSRNISCTQTCNAGEQFTSVGGYDRFTYQGQPSSADASGYLNDINEFKALHSPSREFQLNFVGYTGGACSPNSGTGQSVGSHYMDMASRSGGTSHCITSDMAGAFSNIARNINQTVLSYELRPGKTVSRVRIKNGANLVAGTHYNISGNRITFVSGAVSLGAVIEIVYAN